MENIKKKKRKKKKNLNEEREIRTDNEMIKKNVKLKKWRKI